jgi:hypothetical protein
MEAGFVGGVETDPVQGKGIAVVEGNEMDETDPGGVTEIGLSDGTGIAFGGVDVGEEGFEIDDEIAGGRTGTPGLRALVALGEGEDDGRDGVHDQPPTRR